MTKGIIKKLGEDWVVIYDEIFVESTIKKNQKVLLLHPDNVKNFEELSQTFDNIEGKVNNSFEVEFEIVDCFDNNGPEHFKKFARIIIPKSMILTPKEDELKDWDITLNDGLENEPYVSN